MGYTESYAALKKAISLDEPICEFGNALLYKCRFTSSSAHILPGNAVYRCAAHDVTIEAGNPHFVDIGLIQKDVHIEDTEVEENKQFNYHLLKPKGTERAGKVIFLLHGFNEKNWEKYLPWAQALCERTGHTIVFFPIAFHMQRAPAPWSEKRLMFELSEERKKRFPHIIHSTLSNVAISMRLHSRPQRFIWSGLQTYYDFIQLLETCKAGKHEHIASDFSFGIFAYSIGGLLAQILKLSNYKEYFTGVKVGLFCGGAVFNRMQPVSKFILDSESKVALYYFLVEHLDSFLKEDARLRHYISDNHVEGKVFRAMLDFQYLREFREELFRKAAGDIYAISLKKDEVIPSFEIMNTLQGAFRGIDIPVDEFDFPFPYTHENPFPIDKKNAAAIDAAFEEVFNRAGAFFNK